MAVTAACACPRGVVTSPPRSLRAGSHGRRLAARVAAAVALGLLGGVPAVLPPPAVARVLGANHVTRFTMAAHSMGEGLTHCQAGERLPRGTGAVRLSLRPLAGSGPRVTVVAQLEGGRTVARGVRRAGWRGRSLTVPLRPRAHRAANVQLCMTAAPGAGITVLGRSGADPVPPGEASGPRVRATYLDAPPRRAGEPRDPLAALLAALLRLLYATT